MLHLVKKEVIWISKGVFFYVMFIRNLDMSWMPGRHPSNYVRQLFIRRLVNIAYALKVCSVDILIYFKAKQYTIVELDELMDSTRIIYCQTLCTYVPAYIDYPWLSSLERGCPSFRNPTPSPLVGRE